MCAKMIGSINEITEDYICIYGAGDIGHKIKTIIDNTKQTPTVKFFIDDNPASANENLEVLSLSEYQDSDVNKEVPILVSPISSRSIVNKLKSEGINNYILPDDSFFKEVNSNYDKIMNACKNPKNTKGKTDSELFTDNMFSINNKVNSRDWISENSDKYLFIIGSARSGTSILFLTLNYYNEIFMLAEDTPCLNDKNEDYRNWYNTMHRNNGIPAIKGYHLPDFNLTPGEATLFDYYYTLSKRYQYVGSKYALGPHGEYYWHLINSSLIDFHANYFELSNYIITIRKPDEAIYSMHKMFPDKTFYELSYTWLKSLEFGLTAYFRFNNSLLLLHENISNKSINRIKSYLGIKKEPSANWIKEPSSQPSHIEGKAPQYIEQHNNYIGRLMELYNIVKGVYDSESLLYTGNYHPVFFIKRKILEPANCILKDIEEEYGT